MKILMYDLAREQSWVTKHWQRILPDLRDVGYTDVALYVEQRYHFRSLPQHRPDGGVTPQQAAEAGRLCRKFGLQLHWFTNTLGHCDNLLTNPAFRYLAEDSEEGQQLCPSHPDTRPLLKKMLAEFAAINPGPVLHVGGDETWILNSDVRCRKRGLSKAELYLDHYRWVIRQTKQLGKRPAMWGDMLLKYPQLLPEIDRDVLIFDWHYETGSADSIRRFQRNGFEVIPTTSTREWGSAFFPFQQIERGIRPLMREARQLGCPGICQSVWELNQGDLFENQWERIAAAPAVFDGKPLHDFHEGFFGSRRTDQARLQALLDDEELRHIRPAFRFHPILGGMFLRREFLKQDSAFLFYHIHGQAKDHPAWKQLRTRMRRARQLIPAMQSTATKRREYLRHLDLTLDIFETIDDRIETLAEIRAALDRLHPHRLSAARGTGLLKNLLVKVTAHIERCERLAGRLESIAVTRGGSPHDGQRLRSQVRELKTLRGQIRHHVQSYREGTPVPFGACWRV